MTKRKFFLLFFFYFLLLLLLFLYSFTQIDLNLTLCRFRICILIKENFIKIGYFNRPLSSAIYLFLIFSLFFFYFLILSLISKKRLKKIQIWSLIFLTVGVLLFSYPAFSHDVFNYMFDARILTKYHLNPYQFKALDFPADPWTRFMRWTHRTYPYGPVWLFLSIPISFLGMGKFLPTLFLFKLTNSIYYLGDSYLIGKILGKINPSKKLLGITFFAFNPLVIIETLVSAHHESVMIFFALLFIYFLIKRKKILSFSFFLLSAGIKYVTAPLFLLFFLGFKRRLMLVLMTFSLLFVLTKKEIQPWYFLWILPFVALEAENWLMGGSIVFSLGLLVHYTPFLYYGHWNNPVPVIKFWVTVGSLVLVFLIVLFFTVLHRVVEKEIKR